MSRVKRGVMHAKRRRYLLRDVKGFMWGRKSKIKLAKTAAVKAGKFAYFHRKRKKRDFRSLWQIRINAAARDAGTKYSTLIHALKLKNISLDRKILSTLAAEHPQIFKKITEVAK